jgi:hypothetical protein
MIYHIAFEIEITEFVMFPFFLVCVCVCVCVVVCVYTMCL